MNTPPHGAMEVPKVRTLAPGIIDALLVVVVPLRKRRVVPLLCNDKAPLSAFTVPEVTVPDAVRSVNVAGSVVLRFWLP